MKKVKFDRAIPYNDLKDLPPSDSIFDTEVLLKWGITSRALAELNRNCLRIPEPNMLINTISLQEAQSSSAIENIFITDDELYKAISDTVRESNSTLATKEVLRYREAMWAGYLSIKENGKINLKTTIDVFQQIQRTKQGIRSAQSQIVIKRGQSEFKPGEIIYTPPRGEGIIEQKMMNLFTYLNDHKNYTHDPLLKMIIGHYQFEAIHPFVDGNGRTGRILNQLYLINEGLLSHPVLFLSKYILENKDEYYAKLAAVTMRGSWKPWIMYMLDAIHKTAIITNQRIDDILIQMDATYLHAKGKIKWYNLEIHLMIFSQPYIKPKRLGSLLKISSRTTLTKYMNQLVDAGILSPQYDSKEVFFINNDLIRILQSK